MDFDNSAQVDALAKLPPEPPKPVDRSAWGIPWRVVKSAVAGVAGSVSDVVKGAAAADALTLGADPRAGAAFTPAQLKQGAAEGMRQIATGEALTSDVGESFRQVQRDNRPDPVTAGKAEQLVFGVAEPLIKLVGAGMTLGPIGLGMASAEMGLQQSDELRQQGVDQNTRTAVGALTAAMTGGGAVLPLAGKTLAKTAGLYMLGGPGAFVAQQQATKSILERADYGKIAEQFDPLDPYGLAISALIPLPFAIHGGMRNIRASKASEAVGAPMVPEQPPAAPAVSAEAVDAAMVHNLTLQRDIVQSRPVEQVVRELQAIDESMPRPAEPAARPVEPPPKPAEPVTAPRDFGPLTEPLQQARAILEAHGPKTGEYLAGNEVPPAVNNLVIGLQETAGSAARADAFLGELSKRAQEPGNTPANAVADAVEHMRTLTDEQIKGVEPSAKSETDPLLQSIAARISDIEKQMGDMVVRHDEDGKRVTVSDELARVRKEAAEGGADTLGALDADLVNVAAACALSVGA